MPSLYVAYSHHHASSTPETSILQGWPRLKGKTYRVINQCLETYTLLDYSTKDFFSVIFCIAEGQGLELPCSKRVPRET